MGAFLRKLPRFALYLSLAALSACATSLQDLVLQYEKELVVTIVGGNECDPEELKAVGAIVRSNQRTVCSGTLITADTVLTAAHCLKGENPARLFFKLSDRGALETDVAFPIASWTPHPWYSGDARGAYDLALLHLREPVPGVTPLPYRKNALPVGFRDRLTFVGFGNDDGAEKTGSGIKRCVLMDVSQLNVFTFANKTSGRNTCHGDSGGPALEYKDGKWEIVGIISSGDTFCGSLGSSARVDVAAEWIAGTAVPMHVATSPQPLAPEADFDRARGIAQLTEAHLQPRREFEERSSNLPEGQAKEETKSAEDEADSIRVASILANESMGIREFTRTGVVATVISGQPDGMRGAMIGLYLDGIHTSGAGGRALGFLPLVGSGEVLVGSVRREGRSSLLLSASLLAGPRLRLGAPHSLVLGAYYHLPLFMLMRGGVRFPLVGVGASLGYQSDETQVSLVYRYSMTRILYSDEPNTHFLGLAATFPE